MRGEGGREDRWWPETLYKSHQLTSNQRKGSNTVVPLDDHHKSRLVETIGGFKGFSPNEFFEWEDSHTLCSNALSP